jgi:hypothetical protein
MTTSVEHDLPKAVFDPKRNMKSWGTFSGAAAEKGCLPLFYQLALDGSKVTNGNSPSEVVENNPDGDILIASLLFE